MRLSEKEIQIIAGAFRKHFGKDDHLWLFGSRVDDSKKGGDIDLYVETYERDSSLVVQQKLDFVGDLWRDMGEQKIDVVLHPMWDKDFHLPIYNVAREQGVLLT